MMRGPDGEIIPSNDTYFEDDMDENKNKTWCKLRNSIWPQSYSFMIDEELHYMLLAAQDMNIKYVMFAKPMKAVEGNAMLWYCCAQI